ncbi:PREDICTED: uncharacterized protein LOC109584972 [Amphimedon queenslandica]|uniref:Death domain-containing protein n=2 Tax=Amphimedon queenslandica TaxID=400682 RepID=A0AAN0JIE4_AMPQE|nr:PREDICTED: uncharacterized protein LOC109584972 [Amphimedon queenslandica]|eukprot:XP_019856438.1 PREDICTED: uncharacterized protein LOC109584972 [Amphimedon queenslandica]
MTDSLNPEKQLYDAARDGNTEGIKLALSRGANINWSNPNVGNWTPLHVAASRNKVQSISFLIKENADKNCGDKLGQTPVMLAARFGHKESVRALLNEGADYAITDNTGNTAIELAYTHPGVLQILREHKEEQIALREKEQALIAAASALEKGMEEGFITLCNTKMTICGPPGVGKTAFNDLLFNHPPPLKHHSTPIATRPIQAIQRISAKGKVWEKVSEQDLLATLSDAILTIDKDVKNAANTSVSYAAPRPIEEQQPSTQSGAVAVAQSLPDDTSPPQGPSKTRDTDYYSKKILNHLVSVKQHCRKHYEAHWIHLLDSGGQPQFSDMLRIFNRGSSLYIIVMKVTESLHDKPTFTYSINGKPLNTPKNMTMTNLQVIKSLVRSVAASKNCVVKIGGKNVNIKPAFVIVVTHCDQSSKVKQLVRWEETIQKKNSELLLSLKEFLDLFIFYNRESNELVFPVNNLCLKNRMKISADIRERIMSQSNSISFSVPIPIRWYMFEIKMNEEAAVNKEMYGMISLESCYTVGIKLGMSQSDVNQCLVYLDSLTLCIYYPDILHHVAFTNPQFLIDCLSNVVRVSFVDDVKQILPEEVSLPDDAQLVLKRDGVFNESLLDDLGLAFVPNLFSKSDLLSLLKHLCIISPIDTAAAATRYFLPIVLPPEKITAEQKKLFTENCDPLVITFNSDIVLQGLFPTLIVSLLSRQKEPFFFIDSKSPFFPKQLRHAVKLYSEDLFGSIIFVDEVKYIEVYFTGSTKDCYHLRSVILEGLSVSAAALAYNEEELEISAVTYCHHNHRRRETKKTPHPISISYKRNPPEISCSIETDLPSIELTDKRQSCWLIGSVNSISSAQVSNFSTDKSISSATSTSLPVATASSTVVWPNEDVIFTEGTVLNKSHAPIILRSIRKIVFEWEDLGTFLGLETHQLQEIKYNSNNQVQVCRKDMVHLWLETGTHTLQDLITALENVERNDVAADVKCLTKSNNK